MLFFFILHSFAKLFASFPYQAYELSAELSAVGEMPIYIVLLKHGEF